MLANREEFYARPSAGPRIFPRERENPGWMGGVDLVAGGTWLGLNEFGLLVAVTNRKKQLVPENAPSRGLLCRKLLAGRETASVVESALRELDGNRFAGCNLLIADRDSVWVIEAGDALKPTQLPHGLHLLANADLNDPVDRRIERVRREFSHANPATAEKWFSTARNICQLTASGDAPAICLAGPDGGTVSSTVLGIGQPLPSSRYWFAAGPPNSTAYDDRTPLLRQLFAPSAGQAVPDGLAGEDRPPDIEPPDDSPARRAVRQSLTYGSGNLQVPEPLANSPYRILLRDPWETEVLYSSEHDGRAAGNSAAADLPAPKTVRLPAAWQELFGSFRGRIRFRRKFHPPSNICAGDRLAIVFDGVGGAGTVSLNGRPLGSIELGAQTARFDVTGQLRTNNELQVELEFTGPVTDAASGGLHGPVALEIVSGD
ncbi:MAG TPA: NRDE family protein [Planctomycetaceae bacterium]